MKIAFVVGCLHMGGLEKVTVHIVNTLSTDYEIDLIVLGSNNQFYKVDKRVNIIEGNIHYSFLEKLKRKIFRFFCKKHYINFTKEIKFIEYLVEKNSYSAVIAVDGNNAMIIDKVYQKVESKNTFKFITWVHNNYNTYFNNYFRLYKEDLGHALSNSDYVVTLTESDAKSYSVWNQNTVTIYNPVTINSPKPSCLKGKEILFVARLVKEHKGLDYLIELAKKFKYEDWCIRVLGDGPDKEWLQSEIKENKLNNVIILQGSVRENIEKYYTQASIFISTSKWEGLPLVMVEAISSGLPIISFNHSGAVEILGENKYGIVIEMGNVDKFFLELEKLILSFKDREYWGKQSLIRSKDFKEDMIIEKWNEILREKR